MKSVEKWAAEIDEYEQTESKVRAIRDEQRQACVKAYVDARRNGGGDMECQVAIGNAGNAGVAPALKPGMLVVDKRNASHPFVYTEQAAHAETLRPYTRAEIMALHDKAPE